jgi:hypothetical protein
MVSAICWNNIVLFPVKYIPNAPTITELNEKLRKASNDNRVSFPYPVVPCRHALSVSTGIELEVANNLSYLFIYIF